jgi:Tfp pilus assembly protein PilF
MEYVCMTDATIGEEFRELRRLLERSPGDYAAMCQLGLEQQCQGRREESRQCYETALRIAPPSYELSHNLGMVCRQLGAPKRARVSGARAGSASRYHEQAR